MHLRSGRRTMTDNTNLPFEEASSSSAMSGTLNNDPFPGDEELAQEDIMQAHQEVGLPPGEDQDQPNNLMTLTTQPANPIEAEGDHGEDTADAASVQVADPLEGYVPMETAPSPMPTQVPTSTVTQTATTPRTSIIRRPLATDVGFKPSAYNGVGDFEDFRMEFSIMAEANQWTEAEKLRILPACLRGDAMKTYKNWRENGELPDTAEEMLDALERSFTDTRAKRFINRQLFNAIHQLEGESIERFYIRFTTLARQAGETVEENLMERWLSAIDTRVANAIAGQDFHTLLQMAERSSRAYSNLTMSQRNRRPALVANMELHRQAQHQPAQYERPRDGIQGRVGMIEEEMRGVRAMMERIERNMRGGDYRRRDRSPSEASSRGGGRRSQRIQCRFCGDKDHMASYCKIGEPVCYKCHRPGHIAKDCRRNDDGNENGRQEDRPNHQEN